MKRNLAVLASTKPPFVPSDDYHRFSSVVTDREAEALVVRSPLYIKKHQLGVCIMRAFLSCSSLKKNEQKPQYQEAIILASETSSWVHQQARGKTFSWSHHFGGKREAEQQLEKQVAKKHR